MPAVVITTAATPAIAVQSMGDVILIDVRSCAVLDRRDSEVIPALSVAVTGITGAVRESKVEGRRKR